MDISQVCDALGNETRYQIVKWLKDKTIETCCGQIEMYENGACVLDVVKATGLTQSTITLHLIVLEEASLIYKEKLSYWTCYFLNKQTIGELLGNLYHDLI